MFNFAVVLNLLKIPLSICFQMSSDKDPYWELKNGGTERGDAVASSEGADYLPRKRLRSSGSFSGDESVNSAETSPKKAKVQVKMLKCHFFFNRVNHLE